MRSLEPMGGTVMRPIVALCLALALVGCGGGQAQKEKAYRLMARVAGEAVFGEAQACIALCRSHVVTLEYARVTEVDVATAQASMQASSGGDLRDAIQTGHTAVDGHMARIPACPPARADMHAHLTALYATYDQIYRLATKPGTSMRKLNASVNELESTLYERKTDFDRSAKGR